MQPDENERTNRVDGHELPDVGTAVVQHRQFGEPLIGEVVPRETWEHPDGLTADSFVVEFEDRTSRVTVDEASTTGEVVHLEP